MELLSSDIKYIKGVGQARAGLLAKMGIFTIEDMLYFFPRYVEDRRQSTDLYIIQSGENICISATVCSLVAEQRTKGKMKVYKMLIKTDREMLEAVWFNNEYVKKYFQIGDAFTFYGKLETKFGKWQLINPTYERAGEDIHTGRVVPVYHLTANLHQKTIRQIASVCIETTKGCLSEYIPTGLLTKYGLCEINFAIASIHFPKDMEDYEQAKRRLVFEELLFLQIGLFYVRAKRQQKNGPLFHVQEVMMPFTQKLPFTLTGAQHKVLHEIYRDLSSKKPMSRMVQGDVGSGKTILAFGAAYAAMENGYQSAFMVPTEVLAMQHFNTALTLFPEEAVALLTGSVSGKRKKEQIEKVATGRAKIVIGTHALLENNIAFQKLGLVITDEQHRFGVAQRSTLMEKGDNPHLLVMSATPIPRTLALILYGDLDISIVGELPPGRQKIDTFVVEESMRSRIYAFMKTLIDKGRQVFIVCPMVEESELVDIKAATTLAEILSQQVFSEYSVQVLHGKMKPSEKNDIMHRFSMGDIQVLVSTTVIEVGINVPNATVMMVENAERFGLAQLHQIRGRVGRGIDKSYCILLCGCGSKKAQERLDVLAKTNDGFVISEKDLQLRGPGDFLGTRQHGLPELRLANLFFDALALKNAQEAAGEIISNDPMLERPEHQLLRKRTERMFASSFERATIN